jgi:hypothetical protein
MIKNIFSSKIVSAASGECFVIGVKLADTEAHAIRFLGFAPLLTSAIIVFHEWQHKAHAVTVAPHTRTPPAAPANPPIPAPPANPIFRLPK